MTNTLNEVRDILCVHSVARNSILGLTKNLIDELDITSPLKEGETGFQATM